MHPPITPVLLHRPYNSFSNHRFCNSISTPSPISFHPMFVFPSLNISFVIFIEHFPLPFFSSFILSSLYHTGHFHFSSSFVWYLFHLFLRYSFLRYFSVFLHFPLSSIEHIIHIHSFFPLSFFLFLSLYIKPSLLFIYSLISLFWYRIFTFFFHLFFGSILLIVHRRHYCYSLCLVSSLFH